MIYKDMYKFLLNAVTEVINLLHDESYRATPLALSVPELAQIKCEDMFMDYEDGE